MHSVVTRYSDKGATMTTIAPGSIDVRTNLADFFERQLTQSMAGQGVNSSREARAYLTGKLVDYVHARMLHNGSEGRAPHRLLAELAIEAERAGNAHRYECFRRLGDLALFMAGVFAQQVRRRVVSRQYYVNMGAAAYVQLAVLDAMIAGQQRIDMYDELACGFPRFADVLEEVSERVQLDKKGGLIRLCERLTRTGRRAEMIPLAGDVLVGSDMTGYQQ